MFVVCRRASFSLACRCLATGKTVKRKQLITVSQNLSKLLHSSAKSARPYEDNALVDHEKRYSSLPPYVDPTLSYAFGRSTREIKYQTIGHMIETLSVKEPHSTAVIMYDEGVNKNWAQFNEDINRLANGLVKRLGLKRGDKVALFSYNCYQFLVIHMACTRLGVITDFINPSYKSHEFNYVFGKSGVKTIFMPAKGSRQSALNDHWSILCDESLCEQQRDKKLLQNLENVVIIDGDYDQRELNMTNVNLLRWSDVFLVNEPKMSEQVRELTGEVCPDDLYGVYYTSGTTGVPKGACVTQYNVINNTTMSHQKLYIERGAKYAPMRPNLCLPLPLFHEFAGVIGLLTPFIEGGSVVFPGMRYSIKDVVDSIMRFKCNAIYLTPTILIDLLSHVEQHNLGKGFPLRLILIAGSPVVSELVLKTHRILPDLEEFRIGYGSSENGVIATMQTCDESEDSRLYTVGPPLDLTEVRIANAQTGETTPLGESGEVQTRGTINTMMGYYNDPDRTRDSITKSLWYKTGDLGIMDKCGRVQIVGRIKDLIIRGGENIYPAEVETVLHSHECIEDAHVFGVPDKRYGEEVAVWIKLKSSAKISDAQPAEQKEQWELDMKNNIKEFCKKRLTYFKVPRIILFVEEFPITPVKKVKKFEMRAQTIKLLNLPTK